MHNNFLVLKKVTFKNFLLIFFLVSFCIAGQTRDNLAIFYSLVDSSGENIINSLHTPEKNININMNLGEAYSLFENHLMSIFHKAGYEINSQNIPGKITSINYVLDQAKVNYGEIFRRGLFGNYFIPREIIISGNYSIKNNSFIYKEFHYNYLDTVKVDNVKTLENISYPFTKGNIPSEPFFSSMFEPLIAIGTAAIAVFLFFTIRSK